MAKLISSAITSLDGFINDRSGKFEWAMPDPEVHAFANSLEQGIGTYLYGRRMYEVMSYWQTVSTEPPEDPIASEFAKAWQAAEKIVFSRTLEKPGTPKTRIERSFDPESIRKLKASWKSDLAIAGPTLAGEAMKAGLVDELHVIVVPVVVGGGTRSYPADAFLKLELLAERRFQSGFMHLHYRLGG